MADLQDATQLRAALERLPNERLRTHMLQALDAFENSDAAQPSSDAASTAASQQQQQDAQDRDDPIAVALRAKRVMVTRARDALFLALHGLILESGFQMEGATASELALPPNWDATSANGLFTATYRHANDLSIAFELQTLFVGGKMEVYISEGTAKTHSIELSVDAHVHASNELSEPAIGADVLCSLDALRQQVAPFVATIVPAKRPAASAPTASPSPPPAAPSGRDPSFPFPAPSSLPPVGSGDVLPPGLGGGEPGMLVGPDSALFGRRYDPSQGPVPGARFDPYGPPIDPLRVPGVGGRGGRPGPNLPFGTPNPDHLRMPREDDDDLGFGFGGAQFHQPRGGRGGGGGFGGHQPFGSDHSFF